VPGDGLAIVAGRGVLPRLIAEDRARRGLPYLVVRLNGGELDWAAGHPLIKAELEKPGRLFAGLRRADCGTITFAGGVRRRGLDPLRFDLTMLRLAPRLLAGLRGGDDAALRLIAGIFESEGFTVRAPHEFLADLIVASGVPTRAQPGDADREDAARAAAIVAALGAADAGQGAVVAQGICLGLESIQGTDAMLDFVTRTGAPFRPDPDGAKGVLYKAPKPEQDWRFDLPAIGPATVAAARAAGLAGIVVQAGGVLLLGREETVAAADAAGLFLWGREAG
jgi:DUF1009 family protein